MRLLSSSSSLRSSFSSPIWRWMSDAPRRCSAGSSPRIVTTCRRRSTALQAWVAASGRRVGARIALPKRAMTSASSRSVLASWALAKTWRGLTTAVGICATASPATTARCSPPVDSSTTSTGARGPRRSSIPRGVLGTLHCVPSGRTAPAPSWRRRSRRNVPPTIPRRRFGPCPATFGLFLGVGAATPALPRSSWTRGSVYRDTGVGVRAGGGGGRPTSPEPAGPCISQPGRRSKGRGKP